MLRSFRIIALLGVGAALLAGCGQNFFADALPLDGDDVDTIISNTTLEPQEKRDQLAANGMDDVTINALMRDERLGNQFGGDLRSALDKVENDRLDSLTPDEVQYFGDATDVTTYSDAEALAIADLFADNAIGSTGDLRNFLDDPAKELPAAIDQTDLEEVFINTSLDTVRDKL